MINKMLEAITRLATIIKANAPFFGEVEPALTLLKELSPRLQNGVFIGNDNLLIDEVVALSDLIDEVDSAMGCAERLYEALSTAHAGIYMMQLFDNCQFQGINAVYENSHDASREAERAHAELKLLHQNLTTVFEPYAEDYARYVDECNGDDGGGQNNGGAAFADTGMVSSEVIADTEYRNNLEEYRLICGRLNELAGKIDVYTRANKRGAAFVDVDMGLDKAATHAEKSVVVDAEYPRGE